MNYLIAVLSDRIQAEEAYTLLEKADIPPKQMTIVGKGYKSADEFGFIDPNIEAQKNIKRMATWLIPFGFFGGFTFDAITTINTFGWAGEPFNHIIGGILGAIGGAMGSLFIGGGIGIAEGSGDALPYRNRLNAGKYLVIVSGDAQIKKQATAILRSINPENLQGYTGEISQF
jgi:hypothetical protein